MANMFKQTGNQVSIDLSDQPNGVYFINIELKDNLLNRKVYIMR